MRYEIFNPCDGKPIATVPFRWLAAFLVKVLADKYTGGLDYEKAGEGWV